MEDNFDIYLIDLICNEELNTTKYCSAKYFLENNEENKLLLLNTFTTFMNGDIDENHTSKFIKECILLLEDNNQIEKSVLYKFFNEWQNIAKKMPENFIFELLQKILSNDNSKKSYVFTEFIWSFEIFRKAIKNFELYDNSKDFMTKGIFKNIFCGNKRNFKTKKLLECYKHIINDKNIYPDLIKYLHTIVKLNNSFSSATNLINIQNNCSTLDFNIFLMELINKIYENNKNEILSSVNKDISSHVVDFKIENLDINNKIYITFLHSLRNTTNYVTKSYDMKKAGLIFHPLFIKAMEQFICSKFIENSFIDYFSKFKFIKLEEIFDDCANYYDFLTAYNEEFSYKFSNEFYGVISNILGGFDENIKNHHTRIAIFNTIKKSSGKTGFSIYPNFFDNLFKFINEIDCSKFGFLYMQQKILHFHSITQILLQMTDVCSTINDRSKYIFPETIYRLISNSFELFDMFNEKLYEEIKTKSFFDIKHFLECYFSVLETVLYTILIYNTIYEKNIIDTIYSELEEKMIFFIGRILDNSKMNVGNKFVLKNFKSITEHLVPVCFSFLHKRLNSNIDIIFEIKDQIKKSFEIYDFEYKNDILSMIDNYKETEDYPAEFIDPITCKYIKNPVMIPNSTEIFERISIVSQIYNQGINPYTREKLTLEILEEHNKKEEIKNKIKNFEDKKNNWKNTK